MKTIETTMNGKGQIRREIVERTQLDYDIEEARYEMLGTGETRKQREARQYTRKMHNISLAFKIQKALQS